MSLLCQRFGLVAAVFTLGCPASLLAHGPFDNSANIIVGTDQIEVTITLGPDAALKFFSERLPGVPRPQPVGMGRDLPIESADQLFRLVGASRSITPEEFRVLTDGLEYAFVARYRGTGAADWQFRAQYFELGEHMPPGPLRVQTETGGRLHESLLTHARPEVEFKLPPRPGARLTNVGTAKESTSTGVAPASAHELGIPSLPQQGSGRLLAGMALALAAAIAGGLLIGRRRA
jgi:hypothetical protein